MRILPESTFRCVKIELDDDEVNRLAAWLETAERYLRQTPTAHQFYTLITTHYDETINP